MRSLFLRFLLAFLLAMSLVFVGTVSATVWIANAQRAGERAEQEQLARAASTVLTAQGSNGLIAWLRQETADLARGNKGYQLYVLDNHAHDLLDRPVPEMLRASLGRGPFPEYRAATSAPRPDIRLLSRLVSPENEELYLSYFRRMPRSPWGIFSLSAWPPLAGLLIALGVGAIVCYLLARFLSAPIGHLRAATHAVAGGDLSAGVSNLLGNRHDELAMLAVDFDAMTRRLRAVLEAQQQLLRDISHELRSPLTRMQIALGLARRPNADLSQELDRLERDTQRLDELIGEIMSLCRLDEAARKIEPEPVAIDELLDSVCENARVEAEPRGIRIVCRVSHDLAVQGQRELLYRALENVLRNAVHFSPEGGAIGVTADADGAQVCIKFEDHGPGVPAEFLERIFEPFFRVSAARERDTGGTGVGLAITRRVVDLHHGQVRAENLAAGGLRLILTLPALPAPPKPAA